MTILKKLGVLSTAKIGGIFGAITGLLAGIMFFGMSSLINSMVSKQVSQLSPGSEFSTQIMPFAGIGIFMIIIAPIFYGIMGFIGGAIYAFLYNLIAKWVGGIQMEFEDKLKTNPTPP